MPGFTAVASRRILSAGTMLVFGGGLALYQMTSLVWGPAGSRDFHLSLSISAVEDELSEPNSGDFNLELGTLVAWGPAASGTAQLARPVRSSSAYGALRPAAPAPIPVASQSPAAHPSAHPVPPTTVPRGDEED